MEAEERSSVRLGLVQTIIASPSMKRKREELDDSDDDEPAYGKQILPVANLPQDFDEEPVDGMQYLFTVRYVYLSLINLFIWKSYLGEMPANYQM